MTTGLNIQGLGVSEGIQMGKAFVYTPVSLDTVEDRKTDHSDHEAALLRTAKEQCLKDLDALIERAQKVLGEEKAVILKGQVSMLNDPSFFPPMEKLIIQEQWSAETAIRMIVKKTAGLFESMANEYMRERAADVRDVGGRLLMHVRGRQQSSLSDIQEEVIIVADDLTPSDTVQLDTRFVKGFITRVGGKTSHTAILANSLGIAAILGAGKAIETIQDGDYLVIDGSTGSCVVNPDEETLAAIREKMRHQEESRNELQAYANAEAVTSDGFRIEVAANIGTPEEARDLIEKGAEGVGLYRTEFLFMSRSSMPDEEIQYNAYKSVAEAMQGRPVVIRTLDIGGDKELPYLELEQEMNPFLGYRAIRLCLDRQELLVTQLRAILRASVHGNLKIMFPMISGLEEWRKAKAIYEDVRAQLQQEGIPTADTLEIGIMIEIPSAALQADRFAKEVDFFSIGTNDLVQYTVAVDRMNERVSDLYDYFHPAVIRLIKQVIDASNRQNIWTGMCGSMAGDPLAAPLLVGLGLHEWSMAPSSMQKVKRVVTQLNRESCSKLAERILDMDTPTEVRAALESFQA
ncbi:MULTISPECIES: phosphoenolpyruvate--protein phosphotransferase [unclassified Paenibacillus]|uniref:phosphoenolpyruvate--protein phosphotransferase n=1 Tax=unclassified Paenibacillus TaxID=185978 RepID=UPI001AE38141|nr:MULTISPECIES: phosphoenolpyruvate--protein phosphotransferase [unclassified Paenibacillus]MBP1157657.1 phosphotransferase system enzyme I (PtsI) [Paenibacillus sp. PvP091]MBP1171606.1 phosphotransferase system enzyme I (PtsI) [Paenibacillus sp. PvR098]MBP2437987.1 phosphotransferase system enzyme I (PtsI) [Paenibacillus sp. PvP052]